MAKPLTEEDRIIQRLARGPIPMKVVATGVELALLANLTRKGMASFDKSTRSYVKNFVVAR